MGCISSKFKKQPGYNQNFFISDRDKLKMKLNSALKYVIDTCVLGANNKIKDIEKTNAWSLFQQYRYNAQGQYFKTNLHPVTYEDRYTNALFDQSLRKLIPRIGNWYYRTKNKYKNSDEISIMYRCRQVGISPLSDPKFNLNDLHINLLIAAMLTMEKRQGNCLDRLYLLAKYLWENSSGINRIEIFSTTTFDHCLLVVNRLGDSKNPSTWGDAWIIDAWVKDKGMIFHASEFKQKIKEIKQFAKLQIKKLKDIGISQCGIHYQDTKEVLDICSYEIKPTIDLYPTYSTSPFYPIEFYYIIDNIYPKDFNNNISNIVTYLDLHKEKFKECQHEINKRR